MLFVTHCIFHSLQLPISAKYCLHATVPQVLTVGRGGSRKKYLGGLAPHHLGGNNEQKYCIQLSSIKQLMHRNYPEN